VSILLIVEPGLTFLRFGEDRDRNKRRSVVAAQVGVTEFKITHSSAADANEGWSVDTVFPSRATLEAAIDYRKGFEGGDGKYGTRPPPTPAHADDPDPNESAWTKLADLMSFH